MIEELKGKRRIISEQIMNVLLKKVKSIEELQEMYLLDNQWCLELARKTSDLPKDWNLAIVEDAAYHKVERAIV